MKILVTGGLGFIGSTLSEFLIKNNHSVIVITRSFSKKNNLTIKSKNLQIIKMNINNFKKFSKLIIDTKPEIIFHLAGETSHYNSFSEPIKEISANIGSTICALETIKKHHLKCKFILGSTFVTVGKPDKLPVDENSSCHPTSIYGVNKLASENLCYVYNRIYNLDTVIFRITNCFGPKEQIIPEKNAVNYLIYQAYKKNPITLYFQGNFYRDIIFIDDVIAALNILMYKGKSGNLYWISSAKKTWFYKFGKLLSKHTGSKIVMTPTPKYTKKVDVGNFVANNCKLRRLGWKPKITNENGILITLDYFKKLEP